MQFFYYIFWISLFIIFYNYMGYGLLLWVITSIRGLYRVENNDSLSYQNAALLPEVTLVVAAYNEEAVIEEKIANCLALDYPEEKLTFLFITDGSSDSTPEIISRYPGIKLLHRDERNGKTAALNRAMEEVKTPITVFCDANTLLNRQAIKHIALHYTDPRVGGVAGEKRILSNQQIAGAGEGLYWKYESFLKEMDARLYTVTGAAGELFSIRTALWEKVPEEVILDDFMISARINLRGYRIAYAPAAYAMELPSDSIKEEKKRKVRIAAGAFQSMILLKSLFNVFRYPVLFFQFFSHRFLRWTLTPLSLPLLLLSNIALVIMDTGWFYTLIMCGQILFYLLAGIGAYVKRSPKLSTACYYLVFMNAAVYLGFIRFVRGKQLVTWERAGRAAIPATV